jgi:SPP1 family phage portal protein
MILNENTILDSSLIKKIVETDSNRATLVKMYDYYIGKQDILNKYISDTSKPNNKIVENYCSYISDFYTGYFLGNGISYSSAEDSLYQTITEIFEYNDEQEQDISLALDASIYGIAYELFYIDNDKNIRFKRLNPVGIVPIYSSNISGDLLYVLRYYTQTDILTDKVSYYYEVYSRDSVSYYEGETPVFMSEESHSFEMVPVSVYQNNQDAIGDFASIISLQDAINKLDSFSMDDIEAFSDCYMVLKGLEGSTEEELSDMKNNKMLLLPTDATVEYLTKTINDAYLENIKDRLISNIHKISKCPDLTEQTFGTTSGIAMQYKLIGFEANTSRKERYFKKGIQRRIELIISYLSLLGSRYNYRDIDIMFSRSLPVSDVEATTIVTQLQGIVSNDTLLQQLSFITDSAKETEKLDKEKSSNIVDNNGQLL